MRSITPETGLTIIDTGNNCVDGGGGGYICPPLTPTPTPTITNTPTVTNTPTPTSGEVIINAILLGPNEYLQVGNNEYLSFD
jgi:hypothetical protein